MLKHVIVAVDGASISEAPLAHAVELARCSHATLTGLFVIDNQWADFIGNDWQSTAGTRQSFLDYMRREQQHQATHARNQFETVTVGMEGAHFRIEVGDPTTVLCQIAQDPGTDLLVYSPQIFAVAGRPSLKSLAKTLTKQATRPLLLVPSKQ